MSDSVMSVAQRKAEHEKAVDDMNDVKKELFRLQDEQKRITMLIEAIDMYHDSLNELVSQTYERWARAIATEQNSMAATAQNKEK